MKDFIHLHNHSDLSLLDGAQTINAVVNRAKELNMPAIALTEHGNMFSTIAFYKAAKKAGIKPIIGCEVYTTPDRFVKKSINGKKGGYNHLILLAKDNEGYKNLVKLVSYGYTEGFYYKPRVDKELLRKYSKGLIALSGCVAGEPQQAAIKGNYEQAKEIALEYAEIFPDNYYLEVQNHDLPDEVIWRDAAKKISKETGIPRVATNDAHYAIQEHWEAHDVHICIGHQKEFDDPTRMRYEPFNYWIKTQEEMEEIFPDDNEVFENTIKIADQCNVTFTFNEYFLPKFPLPEGYDSENAYLRELTYKGIEKRYDKITDKIKERIELELDVIKNMGFAGYFLITQDFVMWAKNNGIPVGPGRGSAAGSIVCYATQITDIDPLPFNLLFERFLNPERVSMPDIDIDFCDERRPLVIDYIKDKYGADSVCNIITFGKMKAKGVIRDVGRVLAIPLPEVNEIAKIFEDSGCKTLKDAFESNKEIQEYSQRSKRHEKLFKIAVILEGNHRQSGVHAAGVVVAPGDLTNYLPIQKPSNGDITTQYDMKCIDDMGLLKVDFLGLRNLSVIDKTISLLKKRNIDLDIHTIDPLDKKTFELFGNGNTIGVFQFESGGMREYLSQLKPTCLDDLIAMNALYRPGPMAMIGDFIARKHGTQEITYLDPKLEPILKDTYGIIVYQEQVMQIGTAIGGFSLAKADLMRRAMGKKDEATLKRMEVEFTDGAKEQNIDPKIAAEIFSLIFKFASYGFNKSHAAAYAYLAYQIGYLKTHYPAEFLAANLTSEINDSDRVVILTNEVTNLGLKMIAPDINKSGVTFLPDDNTIRFGLNAIKNVGKKAAKNIVETVKKEGPFDSFFKFVNELDLRIVNKKALEGLVNCGACDSLEGSRSQKFHSIETAIRHAKKMQEEKDTNQISLFDLGASNNHSVVAEPKLPLIEPWRDKEKLLKEKELLGFYISGHPLVKHKDEIEALSNYDFQESLKSMDGQMVKVGGMITAIKIRLDKKDRKYALFTLEGLNGKVDVMAFSSVFEKFNAFIEEDAAVFLEGKADCKFGDGKILASYIGPLDGVMERKAKRIHISLPAETFQPNQISDLKNIITKYKGTCEIMFHVYDTNDFKKSIRSKTLKVDPSIEFINEFHKIFDKKYIRIEKNESSNTEDNNSRGKGKWKKNGKN